MKSPRRHATECSPRTLATGSVARIEHCLHCQAISLHLGPFTIRLEPRAAESLLITLTQAMAVLNGEVPNIPSHATPHSPTDPHALS